MPKTPCVVAISNDLFQSISNKQASKQINTSSWFPRNKKNKIHRRFPPFSLMVDRPSQNLGPRTAEDTSQGLVNSETIDFPFWKENTPFKAQNIAKTRARHKKRRVWEGDWPLFFYNDFFSREICLVWGKVSKGQLFLKWIFLEGSRHPTAVFDRYIFGVQVIPNLRSSSVWLTTGCRFREGWAGSNVW